MTSGIRLGTPAVTTRGMKEEDMVFIADIINETLTVGPDAFDGCREKIDALLKKYPLY